MTSLKPLLLCFAMALSMCVVAVGQGTKPASLKLSADDPTLVKASPAYAELQLKRTDLFSELESLVLEYTEEFPKVKEIRHTLSLFDRDIARISKIKANETSKLTLALGKLILRRIELETDLWTLQKSYKEEHPDVKRAKRKVDVYETAISDILN